MMQKYKQREFELNRQKNEIQLLKLYQSTSQQIIHAQILSRLKKILLTIPVEFQADPKYIKNCNDKYFFFISQQITESLNKQKPQALKLLYHVVSLRIKLWFNKKQFDDIFSTFLINIEHNRKMIPFVIEFFIQLVDTFSNCEERQNQSTFQLKQMEKSSFKNLSRFSLTRKTNSQFFSDQIPNKRSWRMSKHLNSGLDKKNKFTKENRFQRQFLDFELNKILIFANEVFNRAIVQNPSYNYQDPSQDQQEQIFFIKMSMQNIAKTLQLIHKIITFDFFNERKNNQVDQYLSQRSPLIIPTKYSKHCHYAQFQNWIRNKSDLIKYQFLYFYTTNRELKIVIVRLFGDMLRIHQKYFKKEIFYKNHIETILDPLKNMIENLQIRYNQQFQLAHILGQNLNKLLTSLAFPIFANQIKNQFKADLIESINQFIHKQILKRELLDANMIKYYIGFLVETIQKLSIPTITNTKKFDFKEDVELTLKQLGQEYQKYLYQTEFQTLVEQKILNLCTLKESVNNMKAQQFQQFFLIFKVYSPRKNYQNSFNIHEKCIFVCSKLQYNLTNYENLKKLQIKQQIDSTKLELSSRYAQQSLYKMTEIMTINNIYNLSIEQLIESMKYKLMTANFFIEKIQQCSNGTALIFDQADNMFNFTRSIIQTTFFLQKVLQEGEWDTTLDNRKEIQNLIFFAQGLLIQITQLNQSIIMTKQKQKALIKDFLLVNSFTTRRQSFKFNPVQLDQQSGSSQIQYQCQVTNKELKYYQKIIERIDLFVNKKQQGNRLEQVLNFDSYSKGLLLAAKKQRIEEVIEPLYKLYFISLNKCQNHRKQHNKFIQQKNKNKIDQNSDECEINEDQSNKSQDQEKALSTCSKNIQSHNFSHLMNPLSFQIYLKYINSNQLFKIELQDNFKKWYEDFIKDKNNYQIRSKIDTSYFQPYNLQKIMQILVNKYYNSSEFNQKNYLINFNISLNRCSTILLNIFRSSKFEVSIKKQIVKSCFHYVVSQFKKIRQNSYTLQSSFEKQQNQDDQNLMQVRIQSVKSLLETLINIHFFQQKVNFYNQQFSLIFSRDQKDEKRKFISMEENQSIQIVSLNLRNTEINQCFHEVLLFVLEFPEQYLINGFYPHLQKQLINLVKQIYFEFIQFINIYLFKNLRIGVDQRSKSQNVKLNLKKQLIEEQHSFSQQYVIQAKQQNFNDIIKAYCMMIKYIGKIIKLSITSSNSLWLQVRNKDVLPFLNFINSFLRQISNELQLLHKALGLHSQQQSIDQNQFLTSLKGLLSSEFEFLIFFLTSFQEYQIGYISQHLSVIEAIFQMIGVVRELKLSSIQDYISDNINYLNKIVIFQAIPEEPPYSKVKSQAVSKNKMQFQNVRYTGWEYIRRLSEVEEEIILEQLLNYEAKFKHFIRYLPTQTQSIYQKLTNSQQNFDKTQYYDQSLEQTPVKSMQINQNTEIFQQNGHHFSQIIEIEANNSKVIYPSSIQPFSQKDIFNFPRENQTLYIQQQKQQPIQNNKVISRQSSQYQTNTQIQNMLPINNQVYSENVPSHIQYSSNFQAVSYERNQEQFASDRRIQNNQNHEQQVGLRSHFQQDDQLTVIDVLETHDYQDQEIQENNEIQDLPIIEEEQLSQTASQPFSSQFHQVQEKQKY